MKLKLYPLFITSFLLSFILFFTVNYADAVSLKHYNLSIWDFSGPYTESRDGMTLNYTLAQDAKGKVTGSGTFNDQSDEINLSIPVEIKGKVKGKNKIVTLKYIMKGKDAEGNKIQNNVMLKLNESILSLVGTEKMNVCQKGAGCEKIESEVSLDVPDGMTGEAELEIDAPPDENGKKLEGSGELTLSNGDEYPLYAKGKYNSNKNKMETQFQLKGVEDSTKGIKIKLKIAEGSDIATFIKGKALGQQLKYHYKSTGPRTIISDGVEREYYLKLPENYASKKSYPLIFAFHGFTGDYTFFTEGYYDLQEVVGNKAILVYPNALEVSGKTQWVESDLIFFDDLYAELEANLSFDKRKVFATGHSNGAGFTDTLGCRRGDVLRAIAPVSGIFQENYSEKACIGQVASIIMNGDNDIIVPLSSALFGRDYWKAINSCSSEVSAGVDPSCIEYADCDPDFTVQFCEYSGGHEWPDFGGEAVWDFFDNLPPAIPSSTPGTGVPPPISGFGSIKIEYPVDLVGIPYMIFMGLYPSGSVQPLEGSPSKLLTLKGVPVGEYTLGEVKEYPNVSMNLGGVEPKDYALVVLVYVEGGNYPTPISGQDYIGIQEITVDSLILDIETPFELELIIF